MITKTLEQATIITPKELETRSYPIPKIWFQVAGLLKGKKRVNALAYQKQIRKEWAARLAKLERIAK